MARFWAPPLGWAVTRGGHDGAIVASDLPGMPWLLFLIVPEHKTVTNRWHPGLQATTTMKAQAARLAGLAATVVRRVDEDGSVFTVMADVEGNEFCAEQSAAKRAAGQLGTAHRGQVERA